MEKNTTLTLQAGQTYFFKGELRLLSGATLIGGRRTPDARATVNLAGALNTEAGVKLNNLDIISTNTSGGAIQPQVNNILQDVLIVTLGNAHPHGGSVLLGDTRARGGDLLRYRADHEPGHPKSLRVPDRLLE